MDKDLPSLYSPARSFDWSRLTRVVEAAYGKGAARVDKDGSRMLVVEYSTPIGIIALTNLPHVLNVHVRASLPPNEVAFMVANVAGSLDSRMRVNIGENFDFEDDGTWLFGGRALAFAARNIVDLWFAGDPESRAMIDKINEEEQRKRLLDHTDKSNPN